MSHFCPDSAQLVLNSDQDESDCGNPVGCYAEEGLYAFCRKLAKDAERKGQGGLWGYISGS